MGNLANIVIRFGVAVAVWVAKDHCSDKYKTIKKLHARRKWINHCKKKKYKKSKIEAGESILRFYGAIKPHVVEEMMAY